MAEPRQPESTLELYSDEYHRRLADPGESFLAHYEAEYTRLVQPVAGEHLLEIGCSSGRTSEILLERGVDVTGVDFDDRACELARERLVRFGDRSHVICSSADALESFDGYDKVMMLDFVEHVDDATLVRIFDALRAGYHGSIFVYTPNKWHPYEWAQRLHLLSGDPTHINVKSWRAWLRFFAANRIDVVRTIPASSHPAWLARIERPFFKVPLLKWVMVRSTGFELRTRPHG